MATTDATATDVSTSPTGGESSLSNWAGDYVTDMLGKGWAAAEEDYQPFTGDLSAGASNLQSNMLSGLANLTLPDTMGASYTDTGVAQRYMNPYIDTALQAQMGELQRQATLRNMQDAAQLTKAGAYGGSRQAIMNAENTRNLYDQMNRALAEGYSTAYDRGANQFNTEQNYGLQGLNAVMQAGNVERQIEQDRIDAEKAQFEEERLFPYKQAQYMQSLLQGLPITAQNYSYQEPSGFSDLMGVLSGIGGVLGEERTGTILDSLLGWAGNAISGGGGSTTVPLSAGEDQYGGV